MNSDRQLKLAYAKYNKLYFNSELPETVTLLWEPTPGNHAETHEVAGGVYVIRIDPALKGVVAFWRLVLLHELIHVYLWKTNPNHQHGKVFEQEKDRIYQMGALKKLW